MKMLHTLRFWPKQKTTHFLPVTESPVKKSVYTQLEEPIKGRKLT